MRFETTPRFDSDYRALPPEHRRAFRSVIPDFDAACAGFIADPGGFVWPKRLRVRRMMSAPGVWELTWSFTGPDGRATFEFVSSDGTPAVRWRRVGTHAIYDRP